MTLPTSIYIPRHHAYPFSHVFDDPAKALQCAMIQRYGHYLPIVERVEFAGGAPVVMGANWCRQFGIGNLPQDAIIYNFEHVEGAWIGGEYLELLKSHEVWDFSSAGVEALKAKYGIDARHVPHKFAPSMRWVWGKQPVKYDVLFIGSLNERRREVLQVFIDEGLRVGHIGNQETLWGLERDAHIAQARCLINMHFYSPDSAFEIVRCAPALANHIPVITETAPDIRDYQGSFIHMPIEDIAEFTLQWLRNPYSGGEPFHDDPLIHYI